ncbi:kinase-like protein [Martensiomyces pterosporus]|nr:kinase-like protein [Martensiomyces pterosporus]
MSATAAESTATATAAVADSSKRSKYARSTTVIRTLGSERDLDAAINSSTSVAAAPTPKTQKNPRENYDELEEYAEGESGNVFVAHSKKQNKQVAIKVVSKTAKTRYRKLRNELKILRRIRSHHIVRFYEYFSIDDSVWIVYEFMSRGSLTDLLAGYPVLRMPEPVIAYAMHAILTALAYLHERRIVHCDLRSDNVLIGSNGQVKLADFSSAAHLSTDQKSAQKTALGAVYWMAPELAKGAGYSPSTDVWAAGALIYEMLEGQPPYIEYPELKVLELATAKGIPQPSSPDVWSESVVALMRLCCAANPSERPPASRLRKHEFVESPDTVRSARSLVAFVSEVEQIVEDEQEE